MRKRIGKLAWEVWVSAGGYPGDEVGYELYCIFGTDFISQSDVETGLRLKEFTFSNTERRDMRLAINWLHSLSFDSAEYAYAKNNLHDIFALYSREWDKVHWREVAGWNRRGEQRFRRGVTEACNALNSKR